MITDFFYSINASLQKQWPRLIEASGFTVKIADELTTDNFLGAYVSYKNAEVNIAVIGDRQTLEGNHTNMNVTPRCKSRTKKNIDDKYLADTIGRMLIASGAKKRKHRLFRELYMCESRQKEEVLSLLSLNGYDTFNVRSEDTRHLPSDYIGAVQLNRASVALMGGLALHPQNGDLMAYVSLNYSAISLYNLINIKLLIDELDKLFLGQGMKRIPR